MDQYYMQLALELAKKGVGKVNPNPLVGAVIVKDNEIIGRGYHKAYGENHAEINALKDAGNNAVGATLYVTLEPCSHYGKTPPCCKSILKSGIKRCVVACLDPNPIVSGNGIKMLKEAGIDVTVGCLEKEAKELNKVFFKYISTKKSYLFLKCAITLDGKIATRTYDSKWISNELARARVQELRNKFSAIMVGINTIKQDNPRLNCRIENGANPFRIIIDPHLKIEEDKNILHFNDNRTIIITSSSNKDSIKIEKLISKNIKFIFLEGYRFSFDKILTETAKLNIDSVLLEGGSEMISLAFREDAIDEGEIFITPKILGDDKAISFIKNFEILKMSEALKLSNVSFKIYDDNVSINFSK